MKKKLVLFEMEKTHEYLMKYKCAKIVYIARTRHLTIKTYQKNISIIMLLSACSITQTPRGDWHGCNIDISRVRNALNASHVHSINISYFSQKFDHDIYFLIRIPLHHNPTEM